MYMPAWEKRLHCIYLHMRYENKTVLVLHLGCISCFMACNCYLPVWLMVWIKIWQMTDSVRAPNGLHAIKWARLTDGCYCPRSGFISSSMLNSHAKNVQNGSINYFIKISFLFREMNLITILYRFSPGAAFEFMKSYFKRCITPSHLQPQMKW